MAGKLRNQASIGNENLLATIGQHRERHVVWERTRLFVSLAEGVDPHKHPVGATGKAEGANPIELASSEVEHVTVVAHYPPHGTHADVLGRHGFRDARQASVALWIALDAIGVDPAALELDPEHGRAG